VSRLADMGLIRLYEVEGVPYACFPSWHDHQRINRPRKSVLPACPDGEPSATNIRPSPLRPIHGALSERSVSHHGGLTGGLKGSTTTTKKEVDVQGRHRAPSPAAPQDDFSLQLSKLRQRFGMADDQPDDPTPSPASVTEDEEMPLL
jgi:hypothetical protein